MYLILLKHARIAVAVQALAIVKWLVEMKRQFWTAHILSPDVIKSANLGFVVAVHRVVRVAREAGIVARHPIVLKVGRRNPGRVVHIKASTVRFHDVTGQTKLSGLGFFHMAVETGPSTDRRQDKECEESECFSTSASHDSGRCNDYRDQDDRYCQEYD